MRKPVIATILALLLACMCAYAQQQRLVFMPQWTPQTQFAGFYVALEKGYYKDVGLNIVIRHPKLSASESGLELLENGDIHILEEQLLNGIVGRARGSRIVNIMQLSQHNAMVAVCKEAVDSPSDLDGLTIARWKTGFDDICKIIEDRDSLDIKWVSSIDNGNNLFIFGAADAVLCYSYSEYIKLLLSVGEIREDHVLRFKDEGFDYMEDGLYVTEEFYDNNSATLERFVRATRKGWEYAYANPEEAIAITLKIIENDHGVISNHMAQKLMLEEYFKLLEKKKGEGILFESVEKAVFDKMVSDLTGSGIIDRKVEYEEVIR